MKRINNYLAILLIATSMMGCEEHKEQLNGEAYPLSIRAVDIEGVTTRSTSPLDKEDAIIALGTISGDNIGEKNQYNYKNKAWKSKTGHELIVAGGTPICAYYPYNEAINDEKKIPLTSGLYDETKDLYYAYATAINDPNNTTTHAYLVLKHAYSQITFKFVLTENHKGDTNIREISLYKANLNASALLNIVGETPAYEKTEGSVTVNPNIDIAKTPKCSILMVPTETLTTNIDVAIYHQGGQINYLTIPYSSIKNNKLEAGTNYQVTVDVGTKDMSVSSVEIQDWETKPDIDIDVNCVPEANSYIVMKERSINIPVSRVNTVAIARGETPPLQLGVTEFTAGVLWCSNEKFPTVTADVANGLINVKINRYESGNASIFIKDKEEKILWTWHIWTPKQDPEQNTYTTPGNGYIWMDRNLGATDIAGEKVTFPYSGGMMYQWGRKDPFPGADEGIVEDVEVKAVLLYGYTPPEYIEGVQLNSIRGDAQVKYTSIGTSPITYEKAFKYSVQNPLVFFRNWAGSTAKTEASNTDEGGKHSWCSSDKKKTLYDPCPPGWKVPPMYGNTYPWNAWTIFSIFERKDYAYMTFTDADAKKYGNYPITGNRILNGNLEAVGLEGNYWIANSYEGQEDYAKPNALMTCFYNAKKIESNRNRTTAMPIRCIKE